jgi:hypothetical protein
MAQTEDSKPPAAIKAKQANIRLTAELDRLLTQHCNQTGITTQAAIIDALRRVIEVF